VNPFAEAQDAAMAAARFWLFVALSLLCVCCAGIAAGLTLGVATMEPFQLHVIRGTISVECNSAEERKNLVFLKECAETIAKIVTGDHRLMVTLMLFNTLANEALPVFLDQILSPVASVLLSVSVVLICGEILPSALCTGPGQHAIAAKCTPFIQCLQFVLAPVAKPICVLLEKLVPHPDTTTKYTRSELQALLQLHSKQEDGKEHLEELPISPPEVEMIKGVCRLESLKVSDVISDRHCWLAVRGSETIQDVVGRMGKGSRLKSAPSFALVLHDSVDLDARLLVTNVRGICPTGFSMINGKSQFSDWCCPFTQVEDSRSLLSVMDVLENHQYALVVGESQSVRGIVSKVEIIAFLMRGGERRDSQMSVMTVMTHRYSKNSRKNSEYPESSPMSAQNSLQRETSGESHATSRAAFKPKHAQLKRGMSRNLAQSEEAEQHRMRLLQQESSGQLPPIAR
jgi:CBS domain containing-hemolysin-like protein